MPSAAGRRVGTIGVAGTFSFYPGKNLGAYGDAGAIVTNDDALAERCRMYANHGALVKHQHRMEGINSRLDGLQAALLTRKLAHLADWTRGRRRWPRLYDELLATVPQVATPGFATVRPTSTTSTWCGCADRDGLKAHLGKLGIETRYSLPDGAAAARGLCHLGMTPPTSRAPQAATEILSLPIYPEMSPEMVRYVVDAIREYYAAGRASA